MTADIIKGICDDSLELSTEVVSEELFEVHDGGKVFLSCADHVEVETILMASRRIPNRDN